MNLSESNEGDKRIIFSLSFCTEYNLDFISLMNNKRSHFKNVIKKWFKKIPLPSEWTFNAAYELRQRYPKSYWKQRGPFSKIWVHCIICYEWLDISSQISLENNRVVIEFLSHILCEGIAFYVSGLNFCRLRNFASKLNFSRFANYSLLPLRLVRSDQMNFTWNLSFI